MYPDRAPFGVVLYGCGEVLRLARDIIAVSR